MRIKTLFGHGVILLTREALLLVVVVLVDFVNLHPALSSCQLLAGILTQGYSIHEKLSSPQSSLSTLDMHRTLPVPYAISEVS